MAISLPLQVRYSITDSLDGRFRIDEETGVILTRGSFENLDGQMLSLTVGSTPVVTPHMNETHLLLHRCWPQTTLTALLHLLAQLLSILSFSMTSRESVFSLAAGLTPLSSQRQRSQGDK